MNNHYSEKTKTRSRQLSSHKRGQRGQNSSFIIFAILVILMLIFSACTPIVNQPINQNGAQAVNQFSSEAELRAFLEANSQSQSYDMRALSSISPVPGVAVDMVVSGSKGVSESSSGSGSSDSSYSQTNVQVAGIDEADIIKTDGEFLYIVSGTQLYVVDVDQISIVSNTTLPFYANGLYIYEDSVVTFGQIDSWAVAQDSSLSRRIMMPTASESQVLFYDQNNGKLTEVDSVSFEGYISESRFDTQNDVFYFVANSYIQGDEIVPYYFDGALQKIAVSDIRMIGIPYYPQYMTVYKVSTDANVIATSSLLTSSATLYMGDNLYFVSTDYVDEYEIEQGVVKDLITPYLTSDDRTLISLITDVDSRIMNTYEKESKIMTIIYERISKLPHEEQQRFSESVALETKRILDGYQFRQFSVITKLDGDSLEFIGTTKVGGSINNQFSLDEFEGVLRIATTDLFWGTNGQEGSSHVYTLDANLQVLDEIHNIAPGEQIFAARFWGDRLYLVTFEQVDPFFVIDLADPSDISILGELKIPGFSRYLHPISDSLVIGVGQEVVNGRTTGLKVSLFDVTDVTKPIELSKYVSDKYAYSTALYDHKAFMYNAEKGLLIIPQDSYGANSESGALILRVSDELEFEALVAHTGVMRTAYVDNTLFTLSYYTLMAYDLTSFAKLGQIQIQEEYRYYPYYDDMPMPRATTN
jgi:inhibitor of cysteine peptidase